MIKPTDRITTKEAAKMLALAHSTVRGWVWRGKVEAQRVGRDMFVSRREIQRILSKPETRPVRAYARATE